MSRIETCREELNEGISSVEFFNQHIKHLLLDDSKFKSHTDKIDKLTDDMAEVKSQLVQLNQRCASTSTINDQLSELLSRPVGTSNIPVDLAVSIEKLSSLPSDAISHIDNGINKLSEKLNVLQTSMTNNDPESTADASSMQPNTTSPHHAKTLNPVSDCKPFVSFFFSLLKF